MLHAGVLTNCPVPTLLQWVLLIRVTTERRFRTDRAVSPTHGEDRVTRVRQPGLLHVHA